MTDDRLARSADTIGAPGSNARRRRGDLYERLAEAQERVGELEAEIAWLALARGRESVRASTAFAEAKTANDALARQHGELASAVEDLITLIRRTVPSALADRPDDPLTGLRTAVEALLEAVTSSSGGDAEHAESSHEHHASALVHEGAHPTRFVRDAAAESDKAVALAAARTQAERGGTQTLGPLVPLVPLPEGPIARPDLQIACVMDEFSRHAFQYEFDYVDVPVRGWERQLESRVPDALLVESAWRGAEDQWRHRVARPSRAHDDLVALVSWCRARGVPTVFWNKEDPANFDFFKASAQLFDHVFTTDADCIPRYLDIVDHDRVYVLPFAAQPRIHNPIRVGEGRHGTVAFAGTYYAEKHPNRKVQMEAVLDPARDFGLEIFSRVLDHAKYSFPEKYRGHIVGSLSYRDVLTAHKMYRLFLNVNSVVGSSTMCARRIFELLASGTGVVSGVSPAIAGQLGPGLVAEVATAHETRVALTHLLGDDDGRARNAALALRPIMSSHTYSHRVETIRRTVGLERGTLAPQTISVVACVNVEEDATFLLEAVRHQSLPPTEVILVLRGPRPSDLGLAGIGAPVRMIQAPTGESVGLALRRAFGETTGGYVAVFDPKAYYGVHYLRDAVDAFRYTDAAFVGKRAQLSPRPRGEGMDTRAIDLEYTEVGWVEEGSVTFKREALLTAEPRDLTDGALTLFQVDCRRGGLKIFATDRFNYIPGAAARVAREGEAIVAPAIV